LPDREIRLLITSDGKVAIQGINAVNEAAKQMQTQHEGVATGLKAAWVGVAAQFYLIEKAIQVARQAVEYMSQGAKAMQAEEAFKNVAQAYHVNAELMLADLKRLTAGTVDDSDLMQKAFKGMSAGLSPNAIVQIAEISRVAARRMGQDVSEAYASISDAIERQQPRALVAYGLLTKEQARWIQAIQATGKEYDMMNMIMLNVAAQQVKMGPITDNATEALQRHKAEIKEAAEWLGKMLIAATGITLEWLKAPFNGQGFGTFKLPEEIEPGAPPSDYAVGPAYVEDAKRKENARLKSEALAAQTMALAKAMDEYRKSVEMLNPWLTEYDKKLLEINTKAKAMNDTYAAKNALTDQVKAEIENERAKAEAYLKQAEHIKMFDIASKSAVETSKAWNDFERKNLADEKELFTIEMERATKEADYAVKTGSILGPEGASIKYDWQRRMLDLSLKELDLKYATLDPESRSFAVAKEQEAIHNRINNLRIYRAQEITQLELQRENMLLQIQQQRLDKEIAFRAQVEASLIASTGQYAEGLSPGLATMQKGGLGMAAVATGRDPYSLELEKLRLFWTQKVNAYKTGNATIEQVEEARVQWSMAAAQRETQVKLYYASSALQGAIGAMQMMYVATGEHSTALFYLIKAAAAAQASVNAWLAYTQVLADPSVPAWIKPVYANVVLGLGLAGAAAILATAFMGQPGAAGAGSGAGGVGTYSQPAVVAASPAAMSQPPARSQQITVNIYGNVVDQDKFARELVGPLQKALSDGVH
jgi:hypothetical protein